jgi:hypothetical protein
MKDTRSVLLLIVSLLLFVVSFTLLWTWGYRVYLKTPSNNHSSVSVETAPVQPSVSMRDSLQLVVASTVSQLGKGVDSVWNTADSLKRKLDVKLAEFYRLKDEIAALLKDHVGDPNLTTARQKIGELQQRVKELRDRNADVEMENKKLAALLDQLSKNKALPETTSQRVSFSSKAVENVVSAPGSLTVTDLKLLAIANANDTETETQLADQTEKLVGSILIRTNSSEEGNTDLMVVVLQPDGRVVKNSTWESGSFNTSEGKKVYSYKLHLQGTAGETKRLLFSLNADKFQKGNYVMQVYHHGVLVGRTVKTLS